MALSLCTLFSICCYVYIDIAYIYSVHSFNCVAIVYIYFRKASVLFPVTPPVATCGDVEVKEPDAVCQWHCLSSTCIHMYVVLECFLPRNESMSENTSV